MDRPERDVVVGAPTPAVGGSLEAGQQLNTAVTPASAPPEGPQAAPPLPPGRRLLSRLRPYIPLPALRQARKAWLHLQGVPSMPRARRQLPPHPWLRRPDGVVAVGGDLEGDRLLHAYGAGLFPWPGPDGTLLWYSPDPRYVVDLSLLKVPKETARLHRQGRYRITLDSAFDQVIEATASVPRRGGRGTWISQPLVATWRALHRRGHAHSVEAWAGDQLVGGSYGLALGAAFFGESSFSLASSAGAIAFAALFTHLRDRGFSFVDCQVRSTHLERFGQVGWSREEFLMRLYEARDRRVALAPLSSAGALLASTSRL